MSRNTSNNNNNTTTSTTPASLISGSLSDSGTIHVNEDGEDQLVAPSSTRHSRLYSTEEDEEIRLAKQMALAIQQHPEIKDPEQIKKIVQQQQQEAERMQKEKQEKAKLVQAQQQAKAKQEQQAKQAPSNSSGKPPTTPTPTTPPPSSLLIPGRLAQSLQSEAVTTTTPNKTPPPAIPAPQSFPEAQKKRSSGIKSFGESIRSSQKKAKERIGMVLSPSSSREEGDEKKQKTSPRSEKKSTSPRSRTNSSDTNRGVTSPLRNLLTSSSSGKSSATSATSIPALPMTDEQGGDVGALEAVPTSSGRRSRRNTADEGPRRKSMSSTADEGGRKTPTTTTTTSLAVSEGEPIRLSAIVWKRRSGLGKLSATKAWERRRVILQGSKIIYFYHKAHDENEDSTTARSGGAEENVVDDLVVEEEEEEVNATKKTSWFEQAATNLKENARGTFAFGPTEDPSIPRGMLDLVKERATVAAASGHSGAPTPFALSIKVKGDTYWKLCFDTHPEQMEWLAALTDVVVASSVDTYNSQLLAAADPTHVVHDGMALFHGNTNVMAPPPEKPTDEHEGGHRLWMLQEYKVASTSSKEIGGGEEEKAKKEVATTTRASAVASPISEDESATPAEPSDAHHAEDVWTIREKDVYAMVVIVNVALVYSHSSSTSAESFWYVVTFANLGLWFCLTNEETKRARKKKIPTKLTPIDEGTLEEEVTPAKAPRERRSFRLSRGRVSKARSIAKVPVRPPEPAKVGFKPIAGTTTIQIENVDDVPVNDKDELFGGWRSRPGSVFDLRSQGYLTTKTKIPSPGELYECVHCDIFESPNRYPDMAPRVHLPKVKFNDHGPKTWRSPDIFVVSIALPTDPPKLRGSSKNDGGGYTVTMYMTMKKDTRKILQRVTADDYDPSKDKPKGDPQKSQVNAVKLFEEWCRRAPTDDAFQTRFKFVVTCQNVKEVGIPGWIGKYNGKPVLIKRPGQTGIFYNHPELSAIEFDINFHSFPYLAKQAICYLKEHFFKKVIASFGFVIEGRADDELPECIIGAMQLCYPDPAIAIQAADFFAGTSKQSF